MAVKRRIIWDSGKPTFTDPLLRGTNGIPGLACSRLGARSTGAKNPYAFNWLRWDFVERSLAGMDTIRPPVWRIHTDDASAEELRSPGE